MIFILFFICLNEYIFPHFREDGIWVQMAITLSPISNSGQKRWTSLLLSWHNRSSNTHDSWKWLCNPPPGTHSTMYRCTQTNTPLVQYTSSQLKHSFTKGYDFLYCQSGLFVSYASQINWHPLFLFSQIYLEVWQIGFYFNTKPPTENITFGLISSCYINIYIADMWESECLKPVLLFKIPSVQR